ncbi:hypothetical protein ACFWG5_36405 [Streptomyces hydrogenans]|uniref:hypothetical protein n=1 Tax=Streptomyces hydrogenans TaxID=1873719 RepID=UPI003666C30A
MSSTRGSSHGSGAVPSGPRRTKSPIRGPPGPDVSPFGSPGEPNAGAAGRGGGPGVACEAGVVA